MLQWFWSLNISFWFLLRGFISLPALPICFWMLFTFSIRALDTLIVVILSNPNICVTLESGSDDCFVFLKCSYQFMVPVASAPGKQFWQWLSLCAYLSVLQGSCLSFNLGSLENDWSLDCPDFYCCSKDRSDNLQNSLHTGDESEIQVGNKNSLCVRVLWGKIQWDRACKLLGIVSSTE